MDTLVITSTSSHHNPYQAIITIDTNWKKYWLKKDFCTPFYQVLADNIINIPYVDMKHNFMEIDGVIIYRPNHDVGHSIRQAANTQFLLETIAIVGLPEIKNALQHLTNEEREAVMLAAFLFRAGRTNERGGISDPSNAERSALIFTEIAKAVEFNVALVDNIAFSMCHYVPIIDEEFSKSVPHQGYEGDKSTKINKSRLVKGVLDLSHHSDLVRCWGNIDRINRNNLENLSGLLQGNYVKEFNDILLDFARASNAMTGQPYYKHDGTHNKFLPPMLLRKKTVTQVGETFADLSKLMNQFLPSIKTKKIEKAKQNPLEVQQRVNEARTVNPDSPSHLNLRLGLFKKAKDKIIDSVAKRFNFS
ncbi:SidE phosphodiesterase domain-containing protein [Legionella gresilensis]|uniref:SidE phosphodiesterase domain-containing protein n=1 Tax=Legionella gresilensis TaxID=91823 RepID=UPI0010414B91|nr:SidE phosphodiesterase domain-containing protein [Legionella gresilensis]